MALLINHSKTMGDHRRVDFGFPSEGSNSPQHVSDDDIVEGEFFSVCSHLKGGLRLLIHFWGNDYPSSLPG